MTYTTTEALISKALNDKLTALVFSPALPISWPNLSFTPPATTYLRVSNLLNTPQRLAIGNGDPVLQQGIFQVTVSAPTNGGELPALEIAGQIVDHFALGTMLDFTGGRVRIDTPANAGSPLKSPDGSRWEIPVSIAWRAFV